MARDHTFAHSLRDLTAVPRIRVGSEVIMRRDGRGTPFDVVVWDFRQTKARRGVQREIYVEHEDGNCEWIPQWWTEG